VLNHRISCNLL